MTSSSEWPAALASGWHAIAYADEVRQKPHAVTLMGHPLVIFRGAKGFAVLEDRCPHRNVPLSQGKVVNQSIACPYHGWQFNSDGICTKVPGATICPSATAKSFPAVEHGGIIWTCLAEKPASFPILPPEICDPNQDCFWWKLPAFEGRILDAIENLLDPLHSYFLHPGLVRTSSQIRATKVHFTQDIMGCVARFSESKDEMTLIQKLTEGSRIYSYCRYIAPNMAQVAFEDAKGIHVTISVIFSPVSEGMTRPFAHFSTRKGWLPAWIKRAMIILFHKKVLSQDRAMIKMQLRNSDRFNGIRYKNGPLDFFGPVIWALANNRVISTQQHDYEITS